MSLNKNKVGLSTYLGDIPSGIVVFFVALPLCLGIAQACEAPTLLAGIIAGLVGGIIVGLLSGSKVGVSGPAAGLISLVLSAVASLGSYELFLVTVVLSGVFQLLFGLFKLGFIAYYFPNSVIKGMLTGIGLTISYKMLKDAFGYEQLKGASFSEQYSHALETMNMGAITITVIGLLIAIIFGMKFIVQNKVMKLIPGSLLVVFAGVLLAMGFSGSGLSLDSRHYVQDLGIDGPQGFIDQLTFPDFGSMFSSFTVWSTAFIIAIVASLETLLCVEATDKLDPNKNVTPTNRELIAQGAGNIVSGLMGGLPVTQVIVRSSANINSGAKTKFSAVFHGVLLLVAVMFFASFLVYIPKAALAAILLMVGYKLAHPKKFKSSYSEGWDQFIPFIITAILIPVIGLLYGVVIGLGIAILVILYKNISHSFYHNQEGEKTHNIVFTEHMTFLNKASIINTLDTVPANGTVHLDLTNTLDVDEDIWETLETYEENLKDKNIKFEYVGLTEGNTRDSHHHHVTKKKEALK